MSAGSTTEKVYYQGENVLVTRTRAEIGGKTFVMANITSVSMSRESSDSWGCVLLLGGFGLFTMLIGIVTTWANNGDELTDIGALLIGILIVALVVWWARSLKPTYGVNLTSASGEVRVLQSPNHGQVEEIVAALKQAIIESDVKKVETASVAQDSATGTVPSQLKELKELLDTGIITEAEFQTKKAELLLRM